jgi:hypothetical protein
LPRACSPSTKTATISLGQIWMRRADNGELCHNAFFHSTKTYPWFSGKMRTYSKSVATSTWASSQRLY